jgi:hypothetical protein
LQFRSRSSSIRAADMPGIPRESTANSLSRRAGNFRIVAGKNLPPSGSLVADQGKTARSAPAIDYLDFAAASGRAIARSIFREAVVSGTMSSVAVIRSRFPNPGDHSGGGDPPPANAIKAVFARLTPEASQSVLNLHYAVPVLGRGIVFTGRRVSSACAALPRASFSLYPSLRLCLAAAGGGRLRPARHAAAPRGVPLSRSTIDYRT